MDARTKTIERALSVTALGLLLIGCFVVLRPFLSALMWAIILCFATWPVYERLHRVLGRGRTRAATLMTLLIALVLLLPFVIIGLSMADNVQDFAGATRRLLENGLPGPPAWVERVPLVGAKARTYWQGLAGDTARLRAEINRVVEPAATWLLVAGVRLVRGLADLAMSLLIAFFIYRNGPSAANQLTLAIKRLGGDEAGRLLDLASATVRSVVYGILGTALAQGTVAGIGLAIAGVPRAGLLALLTFFLSVVPVGPPMVWVPATCWLFWQGSVGWGIFMAVWGLLVSSIDNVIKPLIIKRGMEIPFILILFGVLGGALTFGFIGLFIGPTLLAVGFRLLGQWNAGGRSLASTSTGSAPAGSRID
jgi:predicted PurR-regulated permease PerM